MIFAMWWFAQEGSPGRSPFDFIGPIAGTGLVGVILLMVVFRLKIMPTYVYEDAKKEWDRERAEKDRDIEELKQSLREANAVYTSQVIPTLTRVLDAERELVDLRRDEQSARRRIAELDREAFRREGGGGDS